MDEVTSAPRRPGWRAIMLVAVLAFVAGLIVTGFALGAYQRWTGAEPATSGRTAPQANAAAENFSPRAPLDATGRSPDYDALEARESILDGRIDQLEARAGAITEASATAAGNATRAEALLVAFAARRALDRGLGLGHLETQLQARFGASEPRAVATVIGAARQPVTLEDLREGIEQIGPDLATGQTTDGWWASLRREVSDLIVIRRAGTASPRPTDRLARARRMLDGGQVEAALAEIARLPGAASGDRWIAAARRYIGARAALDSLEMSALSLQAPAEPTRAPVDPVTGGTIPG